MLRKGNISIYTLLPIVFAYVFTKSYRYNIFTGGKYTGKTYSVSFILVLKFLADPQKDILVLRKYNKDHLSSTYKQYVKTIKLLDKKLKKYGFNLESNFKYTRQPSPEITYLPTGQKIMFAGMDDPGRVAGMTTEDPNRYISMIHAEEPIEVSDLKNFTPEGQTLAAINFATIEDSAFRADVDIENPQFEVYMSMNVWSFLSS
ncbi:MAG: hypothetical protein GY830_03940 [Bacteroidetes bacterium]|nr:hypothetical protein [Bacteroidota bacterium]